MSTCGPSGTHLSGPLENLPVRRLLLLDKIPHDCILLHLHEPCACAPALCRRAQHRAQCPSHFPVYPPSLFLPQCVFPACICHCADVSNAAHGGQVLMDAATFTAVKEAMWRLGAVGPAGLDYDALLATKSRAGLGKGGAGGGSSCMGEACLPGLMPGGGFRCGGLLLVVSFWRGVGADYHGSVCVLYSHNTSSGGSLSIGPWL
jgi:hypothetical protein